MKRKLFIFVGLMAILAWVSTELWARGGRGGGGFGGGGHGGGGFSHGGGGARPSFSGGGGGRPSYGGGGGHTPSMSRPSSSYRPQMSRPSTGVAGSGSRPSTSRPSYNRPGMGNLPTPGARPSGGINTGNVANRPTTRPGGGDFRPGGVAGGGRPSAGDIDRFINPGGSGNFNRPGSGNRLPGGAAGEFLHDHPGRFPGGQPGMTRPGTGDIAGNTRPSRPGGGEGMGPTRPGQGGGGVRPERPGDDRPGGGDRPGRPGEGGSGEQWKPGDRPNRPNRPGWNGGGEQWRPGNRPDRIPNWNQWSGWRNDHRTNIWNNWHGNNWHGRNNWWNHDWWDHHHWHYPYYPSFNYWGWAAWPAVTSWVGYGWQQPVSYNYGDNVYYSGDQVYYGDQPVATTAEYAQQAAAIAANVPATQPAAEDWMPLGVFAITHDGEPSGADPTMFFQLAVSKQGVINGSWQNTATDAAQQIEGMVDKQTQRAAWTPKGKDWPIIETGIVNLTQDTTPALVHFEDGTTQQWLLVRLDKPKDDAAAPAAPATK